MNLINPYVLITAASIVIILSYFFTEISRKTNIPSVIFLLATGVILRQILLFTVGEVIDLMPLLELFGIIGLIMIVLEAALDLELSRKKLPLLLKALGVSVLSLFVTSLAIAFVFKEILNTDLLHGLLYAIPLSVMSSAIVIPSVANLPENKKEFMIYESAFSDILGIMFFYLLIQSADANSTGEIIGSISLNLILTLVLSIVTSYGLIYVFHKLKSEIRLFLLIAVLILLYALGKMLHLSSLIIILSFGLILNNQWIFFKGKLKEYINDDSIKDVYKQLRLVTIESSFVIRTFFFVIFGITISFSALLDVHVILGSVLVLVFLFGVRWLVFKLFIRKNFMLEWLIAPRGLITILLFFNIPSEYSISEFKSEILLVVIIASSLIMALGMMKFGKQLEPLDVNNNLNEDDVKETEDLNDDL